MNIEAFRRSLEQRKRRYAELANATMFLSKEITREEQKLKRTKKEEKEIEKKKEKMEQHAQEADELFAQDKRERKQTKKQLKGELAREEKALAQQKLEHERKFQDYPRIQGAPWIIDYDNPGFVDLLWHKGMEREMFDEKGQIFDKAMDLRNLRDEIKKL